MEPLLSIVIPVYNEEEIIFSAVKNIVTHMEKRNWNYELLLVENGSKDKTWDHICKLTKEYKTIRGIQVGSPGKGDYGLALKTGALSARGVLVVNDEIDIGNFDFYDKAIEILQNKNAVDMVVGSKTLSTSNDDRPILRRFATWCVNLLLRILLGFKGTDTHGLKVWRRVKIEPLIETCVTGKDIFASELVIRAERGGMIIQEIPIQIEEKRQARINILKRVPHVLKNIFELFVVLRLRSKK